MACINPNSPEFKEILSKVNNPLLAEIEMDKSISANDINIADKNTSSNNPIIQKAISWVKSVMPDANVELVDGLIDDIGTGSYDTVKDLITLSEKYANKKTAKHEVFHKAFNSLSKEKQEELLYEGSKLFGINRGESIDNKLNQSLTKQYTGDLAIEEKMAEMMENTSDEKLSKSVLGRWIQSVRNFFRNLFKERNRLQRFMRDINQGRYANQKNSGIDSGKRYSQFSKQNVQDLFETDAELADAVYQSLGYHNINVGWENGKTLYDKAKPITIDFKPGITVLSNGNYLIQAYRTDNTGTGTKGFGQRGEGLYLSLTTPYPGKDVSTITFEIAPSDIVTYKKQFNGTISYDKLSREDGNFQDKIKAVNGKAFIGGINGSEDANLEIVLYDKDLIDIALKSKKKVANFTTEYNLYDVITPQEKQQATFMFSEFLDVYLQDFEQVERILKEENKIEKDCTGGGKLKAEKGLQTNFTKNGEWKIIKDLKGYPTHKEGGVDLTISKNGVSIKNGDTEFTAKHGLVIPKN